MDSLQPDLTLWNIILTERRKISKGCKVQGNGQMKINQAITNYRKTQKFYKKQLVHSLAKQRAMFM